MNNNQLAFFIGLFGSLHCVVMCGPLVMSLPFAGKSFWYALIQKILYQSGRILTYATLGFIAGAIGRGFDIFHLQQLLSVTTGALLIGIAFSHFFGTVRRSTGRLYSAFITPLASQMAKWLSKPYGGMFAGALHGLIPCGMVYMAIAGSLNTASATAGANFMLFFGLGTTPLLFLASLAPLALRKFAMPKLLFPVLFFVSGALLLSRGLNLDIPYLSMPVVRTETAPVCK